MKTALEKVLLAQKIVYEYVDEKPPYFMVKDGENKPMLIDCNVADECYDFYWAYSHQSYPSDSASEIGTVIRDIVSGKLLSFGVFVGEDVELAGFCEPSFLPAILADCANDPMMLGGELRLYEFGVGVLKTQLLSEAL